MRFPLMSRLKLRLIVWLMLWLKVWWLRILAICACIRRISRMFVLLWLAHWHTLWVPMTMTRTLELQRQTVEILALDIIRKCKQLQKQPVASPNNIKLLDKPRGPPDIFSISARCDSNAPAAPLIPKWPRGVSMRDTFFKLPMLRM